MLDGPEFVYAFFGAIKIGAVPVPLNTRWTAADYEYVLHDSGARVVIVSGPLLSTDCRGRSAARQPSATSWSPAPMATPRAPARDARQPRGATTDRRADAAATPRASGCIPRAAPACPRAASICSTTWSCAPRPTPRTVLGIEATRPLLQRGQAVLRVRPRQRDVLSARGRRHDHPVAGPPTPAVVYDIIERYRPTLFFSVPTHYAMLLAHDAPDRDSICRASAAPCRPARRCRPRSSSGFATSLRRRDPRRHRLDRSPAHLHLQPAWRASGPGRAGASCPATRRGSSTRTTARARGRDRQPAGQGRLDVRLLLEPARADQGHDCRPLDPDRRQVLAGRATASSGSPADRTTC